jgi:RNA-directed DNA polymerase
VEHVTIANYANDLDAYLARLSEALRSGTYRPQRIRRHYIPKPGSQEKRPPRDKLVGRRLTGIPTVQNRVVQTALRAVLEPIFERDFAPPRYGFRLRRGCKDPLRRVDELLKAGYIHVVDGDLKSYFDTIPKDRLLVLIGQKVGDRGLGGGAAMDGTARQYAARGDSSPTAFDSRERDHCGRSPDRCQ